jgi:ABC-type nitrate/sulfonate/bicarbonate transport system permease component
MRFSRAAWGLAGLAAFAALGEALPRLGVVPQRYAPPVSVIGKALWQQAHLARFWWATVDTLRTWALGLFIAVLAGVCLGVVIGAVPVLRAVTASTIEFLRPIPSVALIPLAALLYGATIKSTLVLVVYASFWQVLVQVLHGVADVDPIARETAQAYRLSAWDRIWHLYWPTALPYAVTGVRLAASVALILAITGELILGSPGLGQEIAVAQASGAVPQMYALVVVTGLIGLCANVLARMGERVVLAWHPAIRREVPA